jgi:hypothetical protein
MIAGGKRVRVSARSDAPDTMGKIFPTPEGPRRVVEGAAPPGSDSFWHINPGAALARVRNAPGYHV